MSVVIDTRQSSTPSQRRPFVQRGLWSLHASCDANVQRAATLRVSVLAGVTTLALLAAPDFKWKAIDQRLGPSVTISAPEIAIVSHDTGKALDADKTFDVSKGLQRVPALEEVTSTASFTRRPAFQHDEPAPQTTPNPERKVTPLDQIEIIDASTVRTGGRIVRLQGIEPPNAIETCRRLDGLAVSCLDRALSYLQLLVKGRAVACSSAKIAVSGTSDGHCRFGETDVAEQMVRQGWAKAGALPEERIVVAEVAAKRQKLGIWR